MTSHRCAFLLILLTSALAGPAGAQRLSDWVQVTPSARLELTGYIPSKAPAWIIPSTRAFLAPRISGMVDVFAGDHVYALGELRVDRGEAPADQPVQVRIEQLFLRITPKLPTEVSIQAGKFVSPFGNYAQRHHTAADPLIRPPLNYDYRTVVQSRIIPRNVNRFLQWKDESSFRKTGAPVVWGTPYQVGALAFGTVGPAAWRLALMNSAPSSEPRVWDPGFREAPAPSIVAHLAFQLSPEIRIGGSFDRGPYLERFLEDSLRVRGLRQASSYNQRILGTELTFTRGAVELRSELLFDLWQVPQVADDVKETSYYVEGKLKLMPGLAAAARYGAIRFGEIRNAAGARAAWDHDIQRVQGGVLYQLSEKIEARAEYLWNRTSGVTDPKDNMLSLQVAWSIGAAR